MKLDKIKFANLVAFICGRTTYQLSAEEINMLDNMLDTPEAAANPQVIEELMKAIHDGKKIEAIKAYRSLIPSGLKEAKDAIEKDWTNRYTKTELWKSADNAAYYDEKQIAVIRSFIANLY